MSRIRDNIENERNFRPVFNKVASSVTKFDSSISIVGTKISLVNALMKFTDGEDEYGYKVNAEQKTLDIDLTGKPDGKYWVGVKKDGTQVVTATEPLFDASTGKYTGELDSISYIDTPVNIVGGVISKDVTSKLPSDIINSSEISGVINNSAIPYATGVAQGGSKMRFDSATGNLYIRDDGLDA